MILSSYLGPLRKKLWLIILLPLLAGLFTLLYSMTLHTAIYESSAKLYVTLGGFNSKTAITYEDILISQQLTKDYRELIKSKLITREVQKQINISNMTHDELAGSITINPINDTRLMEIRVKNRDAKVAKDLANTVSRVFIEKATKLINNENINIIEEAEMPLSPVGSKPIVMVCVAVTVGLIAALGIVFLISYADDTVKTVQDVEKQLNLTVLGTVPKLYLK